MSYNITESGKRIRQLRLQKGCTQEEVARTLNIDRSFYGRIESGKKGCSVDFLIRLACFFDVSLDYLVLGKVIPATPCSKDGESLKRSVVKLINQLEEFMSEL